jgi:amino acid transporter
VNLENDLDKQMEFKQRVLAYYLECDTYNAGKLTNIYGLQKLLSPIILNAQFFIINTMFFFSKILSPIFQFIQGHAWSCNCSATLKVLAQKDGKEDYVQEITEVFNAKHTHSGDTTFMTFDVCVIVLFLLIKYFLHKTQALMNPELGWYDEATDSIILQAHIKADAPHGVE